MTPTQRKELLERLLNRKTSKSMSAHSRLCGQKRCERRYKSSQNAQENRRLQPARVKAARSNRRPFKPKVELKLNFSQKIVREIADKIRGETSPSSEYDSALHSFKLPVKQPTDADALACLDNICATARTSSHQDSISLFDPVSNTNLFHIDEEIAACNQPFSLPLSTRANDPSAWFGVF